MSNKKHAKSSAANRQAPVAAARAAERTDWRPWAFGAAAVLAVLWAYSPSMRGDFLFDDNVLPFSLPNPSASLWVWIRGVRPVLFFTYWVNSQLSGVDSTFSYHVVNVIFHCIASGMIFLIVRRLLGWAHAEKSRIDLLAGFAALIFLLHPAQAESVAYLAGRSETLSVMLVLAAYALFLYRRKQAATWGLAAGVLLLFALALLSKEHAIALAALLVLTDYWWNPGFSLQGVRENWKLYAPMALGAIAGVAFLWNTITKSSTAGFGFKEFTWYQYFFTQCRALFVYIGMFVLPVNLTADWDFPISKTVLDHGAIVGLLVLVSLAVLAWIYRRRFPLASFGYFAYLVLMAPTSSILPIADPVAERRIYLSMLGLLLILVDFLGRLKVERNGLAVGCAVVLLLAAVVTHARAEVWTDAVTLWEDTTAKSPNKYRAHFQLASAYYDRGIRDGAVNECAQAVSEFERASQLHAPEYDLLLDWGLALGCVHKSDQALAKLRQSAFLRPSANVYAQIAKIYAEQQQWEPALEALSTAEKIDPNDADIYAYRGKIHVLTHQLLDAVTDYNRALAIDPGLDDARQDLAKVASMLRSNVRH